MPRITHRNLIGASNKTNVKLYGLKLRDRDGARCCLLLQ